MDQRVTATVCQPARAICYLTVTGVPGQQASIVAGLKVSTISARSAGSAIGLPTGSPVSGQPFDAVGANALTTSSRAPTTAAAQSTTNGRTAAQPYGTGRSERAAAIRAVLLREVSWTRKPSRRIFPVQVLCSGPVPVLS